MTIAEENKIRETAAREDMAHARKYGEISVCETLIGRIDLSYNAATKTYKLVAPAVELCHEFLPARVCVAQLGQFYDVVAE